MAITKPTFQNLPTRNLTRSFERLDAAVKATQSADGSVDLQKLGGAVKALNDPGAQRAFERLRDSFDRRLDSGSGSGGSLGVPNILFPAQAQEMLTAITHATTRATEIDSNSDGRVSWAEAKEAEAAARSVGDLAWTVIDSTVTQFREELGTWAQALAKTQSSILERKSFDGYLEKTAEAHAATPAGKDAILWAYRDLALRGGDTRKMDDELKRAETSLLSRIPVFGARKRHLSDGEVKKLLGTNDLKAFAEEKKASIQVKVGGPFTSHYLAGGDLDGANQLSDPDYRSSSKRYRDLDFS